MNEFLQKYYTHKDIPRDKIEFTAAQTDNVTSLLEEGLLTEVTELLLEYSKIRIPSGKLLFKLFNTLQKHYEMENSIENSARLLDYLYRNQIEFHSSFKDYILCFKKEIFQIIQDKIGTLESKWIIGNLTINYVQERENSIILEANSRHLILYLKSIWKKGDKKNLVSWFEFMGFIAFKENDCNYLDQMDVFCASLDSNGIIEFSSLFEDFNLRRLVLDSYLQVISNSKSLPDDLSLEKIQGYLKAKPLKKNSSVFSTVLGLLIVDWIQFHPNDLFILQSQVQEIVLPPAMAQLFT